ncbi:hypothetical protein, partial [Segatella copri]|uniref:hypothetical protein n=1 Tax=Segatella copri TaxID=165179 RepID=UPI001B87E4F2
WWLSTAERKWWLARRYKTISTIRLKNAGVKGFSPINLRYMSKFFKLYAPLCEKVPQAADDFEEDLYKTDIQRVRDKKTKSSTRV